MAIDPENDLRQGDGEKPKKGRKVRVAFRRNRSSKARFKDWIGKTGAEEDRLHDAPQTESVVAKGDQSRARTIVVKEDGSMQRPNLQGVVIAVRGLYADVDSAEGIIPCTIRRVLRTRLIQERTPLTTGDRVGFNIEQSGAEDRPEGVIEEIHPRKGILQRKSGRKTQTIATNVDQAIIVSSAFNPWPKPHLIDRYIVSAHYGEMAPVICMNKIDLDEGDVAGSLLDRYTALGYKVIRCSATSGEGIDELREMLCGKESVLVGQSGVGKSSLLNSVQPGLELRTAVISEQSGKGKHTTTTACLHRLDVGGYVVDTPGIRSFDLSIVPADELEAYFVEFVGRVADCKFKGCTHTHEEPCAIKDAVEAGEIHPDRFASYLQLFDEASAEEQQRWS